MGSVGNKLDSPYCGGILVAPDIVLTAASCVAYGSLDYVAIGKKFDYDIMNLDDVETWSHLIQTSMTQVATRWTTGKGRTFA
jgi:secreted trypsin-like serine protease